MTATEELRRLLDERGVEWVRGVYNDGIVEWTGENGRICRAFERNEPLTVDVDILAVTPAQAVEATLGRGECKNKVIEINANTPLEFRTDNFICSACNAMFCADSEGVNHPIDWAFCPNCGAKVVQQ